MLVSFVACLASIFEISRQCASSRVGFVLILLITLRVGSIHTRLIGLRAVDSSLPAVVLSVVSVSLFLLLSLFGSSAPCQSLGSPGASGGCLCFCFVCSLVSSPSVSRLPLTSVFGVALVSSSSRPLSAWPAACLSVSLSLSLSLSLCLLCVFLPPR